VKPGRSLSTENRAPVVLLLDLGPDDGHIGDVAGGDPHLFAVEDVLIAQLAGGGGHAAGV